MVTPPTQQNPIKKTPTTGEILAGSSMNKERLSSPTTSEQLTRPKVERPMAPTPQAKQAVTHMQQHADPEKALRSLLTMDDAPKKPEEEQSFTHADILQERMNGMMELQAYMQEHTAEVKEQLAVSQEQSHDMAMMALAALGHGVPVAEGEKPEEMSFFQWLIFLTMFFMHAIADSDEANKSSLTTVFSSPLKA